MKKLVMCMAGAAALAGCASLITGGDLIREGVPTGTLVFENTSPQPIDTILISTCEAASYGLDRLPEGVTVYPGQRHEWTVSAGCYDVMAGAVGVGSTPGERINVPAGRRFVLTYDGQDR
ncbi:MAG TPA: hypothetical protein VGR32_00965 [Brevundimonas sp.]|jgi:hypothetical protein|uniref:hypothetical protein n=1 Tax=Brevundimonas sp. TaxID=1871086 RepID=UPI002DF2C58F|nr:hypothetical protein [Brevundimonas sp.]